MSDPGQSCAIWQVLPELLPPPWEDAPDPVDVAAPPELTPNELPPDEPPPAEEPCAEVPAVEVPAVDVPAVDVPAVEVPAVELPVPDVPAAEDPWPEEPCAEVPAVDVPVPDDTRDVEPLMLLLPLPTWPLDPPPEAAPLDDDEPLSSPVVRGPHAVHSGTPATHTTSSSFFMTPSGQHEHAHRCHDVKRSARGPWRHKP